MFLFSKVITNDTFDIRKFEKKEDISYQFTVLEGALREFMLNPESPKAPKLIGRCCVSWVIGTPKEALRDIIPIFPWFVRWAVALREFF